MTTHRTTLLNAALLLIALMIPASTLVFSAQSASGLPADINPDSRARLPYVQRKNMDDAAQKVFDVLPGRRPDGALGGPLAFAAYNPAVAKALFDLHNAAVPATLNGHARELAILVACRETNYNLEWNAHEPTAVKEGVDPKVIDVIRRKAALTGVSEQDAAVIRLGRELYTDRKVASPTFAKVVQLYGQRGAMDLVAVMNTYAVSGFYAIAVDEQPAAGKQALRDAK